MTRDHVVVAYGLNEAPGFATEAEARADAERQVSAVEDHLRAAFPGAVIAGGDLPPA